MSTNDRNHCQKSDRERLNERKRKRERERDDASHINVYNKVREGGTMCDSGVYRDTDNDVVTHAQAQRLIRIACTFLTRRY